MNMTKEKKFRVWDKIANKMYYAGDGEFSIDLSGSLYDDSQTPPLNIDYRCILLEYTGLKDENDKEICEGDIVSGTNISHYEDGIDETLVIAWREECTGSGWYPVIPETEEYEEEVSGNVCLTEDDVDQYNLHVIGNIYENPELIK